MLKPEETVLVGQWLKRGASLIQDATCERIDHLVTHYLVELRRSPDGWSTLFHDPNDHRLWERTYPQGEMHGGGPPALTSISRSQAEEKYGQWPNSTTL
ncbi:Imm27 family immunity protein [Thauera mechernichensis]|uniref:Imm27 family immunity protein n=1 Tax=Thauera mechernichensis TaxID=82788 RepID=A0ABW3WC64_9RHOO